MYLRSLLVVAFLALVFSNSVRGESQNDLEVILGIGMEEMIPSLLASEKFVSGRYSKETDEWKHERAKKNSRDALAEFLAGNDTGGACHIARHAPNLTRYVFANKDRFELWLVLDTEFKKVSTEKMKKARKELQGATKALQSE